MITSISKPLPGKHTWKFFRAGGVDQVVIQSGEDIARIDELDLKLWMALSMPTRGNEFDSATLDLIDTDKDGRIRPPEVIAAITWLRQALKSFDELHSAGDTVTMANIKDEVLLKGAQRVLTAIGKSDMTFIGLGDIQNMKMAWVQTTFNGDGIITAESARQDSTRQAIADIITVIAPVVDRNGKTGLDQAGLDKFFAEAKALSTWYQQAEGNQDLTPAGEKTAAALAAVQGIKAKVDDYFARGRLAAFDVRATSALNRLESEYLGIATRDLSASSQEVAGFPLAKVDLNKALPLKEGINPAWASALARLEADALTPLLGAGKTSLSEAEWLELQTRLAPFAAYQASKPATPGEKLGLARLRELLSGSEQQAIAALIAEDLLLKPEFDSLAGVEKLLRFRRDLLKLLTNYVNFADFYGLRSALFQAGTLYLDARACRLCIEVVDPGKHAALAGLSGVYLAYCDITRTGALKRCIVAAFTNGDCDNLMVGRNGIFYDRKGLDWDATVTKVIPNPISLREAFWSPYKKFMRMVEEMVAKRAAAADTAADKKLAETATTVSTADMAKPATPKKVDVGTVAALGVAVGAIGSAITALATGVLSLPWWQIPLLFAGIVFSISMPSMTMAWLKLRQRNLAPILDANGWAINTRAKINTKFGTAMTDIAKLPPGSKHTLGDPFAEKKTPWPMVIFGAVLILATICIRVNRVKRGQYFWQKPATEAAAVQEPAPAP